MRRILPLLLIGVLAVPSLAGTTDWRQRAQTGLHLLDYIAVDYAEAVEDGRVKNAGEYAEMREFVAQVQSVLDALPDNAERAGLRAQAQALAVRIDAKAAPGEIAGAATALRWKLIGAYGLQVAPTAVPDLSVGAALYEKNCALCHGAQGRGDGLAGKGLNPAPSDFHDRARMAQRSVYGLYNTITLGVEGTGMASYKQLDESERWALAFFVANFAADDSERARGATLWHRGGGRGDFPDLTNLATMSANDIAARFGADSVAIQSWLRANPQALTPTGSSPLAFAVDTLARSLERYREGARADAVHLAIQAYLEGFELVEASLQNVDADLMVRAEREMMAYRALLQAGAPVAEVEAQLIIVRAALDEARAKLDNTQLSWATTFASALVILLREGAEAILVLAAILAFLTRAGRADARRWVHLGWIVALVFGAATWVVSSQLVEISGASREITEGVTALVAAAMLLYVGYWLHSKSHSAAWQKFIDDKVSGVLSAGTVWTLALISFLAVYREAFETVLFYQALATQAGPEGASALLGGLVVAALLLVVVAWAILRASVQLPIGLFFSVSGIALVALAVVFTGQGVAALQEAGRIGSHAVNFLRVPMLGVYPTAQSLIAQAAVLVLSMVLLWRAPRASKSV